MPDQDARKWDDRYQNDARYSTFREARPLLREFANLLPPTGFALDVAMGLGGNSAFLLQKGWRVIGLDISAVAVRQAKERLPDLQAVLTDLTTFHLPTNTFNAILNFYYLQRDLFSQYRRALRPGGLLFFETLTQEMLSLEPEVDPNYLLASGELRQAFSDWEILVYREGWQTSRRGKQHPAASLIARKPVSSHLVEDV